MTKPASGVTVAVNGMLVVDDEHTGRVVITGVPTGNDEVILACALLIAWLACRSTVLLRGKKQTGQR